MKILGVNSSERRKNIEFKGNREFRNVVAQLGKSNPYSLTEINISETVENIGTAFVLNCGAILKINVNKNNPNYYSKGNCIIEKKTNKLVLACKNSTIPIEVKTINCRALLEMEDIENINIKELV